MEKSLITLMNKRLVLFICISFSLSVLGQAESPEIKLLRQDVEELANKKYKGREAGTKLEKEAADYIAKRFKECGLTELGDNGTYLQHFKFPKTKDPHTGVESAESLDGVNVVGWIDNASKTNVVIGAHYDHLGMGGPGSGSLSTEVDIHNGADDNASGVAMLLNIALKLKTGKAKRKNYIFVAFTGEAKGLYGANNFLKHPPFFLNTFNYMINLDMVGRLDTAKGILINGVGTSPIWKASIEKADTVHLRYKTSETGIGRSDQTSFYLKDIPALHFFTGSHEDYHKPSDDAEKINYQGMVKISNFVLSLINDLNLKLKLAFTRTKDDEDLAVPKYKFSLGVVPDYMYEGKGLRIDGISEDKAADKAGIIAGDIVVRIGEVEVNDIQTYMVGLSKIEEGHITKVRVLRGDKELDFDIQF